MPEPPTSEPNPHPLYILLILAISICAYFFFLGTSAVRLWFYKGALGPDPERFLVLRKDRQNHYHDSSSSRSREQDGLPHDTATTAALDYDYDAKGFSAFTMFEMQDCSTSELDVIGDLELRKYVKEERRIAQIPVFEADDCGDGGWFPDVPVADQPVGDAYKVL